MDELKKEDKAILMAGLKNGMGFTASCRLANQHPRELSQIVTQDETLKTECEQFIENGKRAMVIISNDYFNSKKYGSWRNSVRDLERASFKLVLWESYAPRQKATAKIIAEAIVLYKNLSEAATAVGFEEEDMARYLVSNPMIKKMIDGFQK